MNLIKILIRKIKSALKHPEWLLIRPLIFISPLLEDTLYLKILFYLRAGYRLDLNNPITFNQKLQWLKINYRMPILTEMADKYEMKRITSDKIGKEHIVKNYGIWNSFDDIDFDALPDRFVLKTTHDQGGIVICEDKSKLNKDAARKKLNKHLKTKNYYITREWPYKNIKPRILAEEFLVDEERGDIWDYKIYCFNGVPKMVFIASGRNNIDGVVFDFFDIEFNHLNIKRPNSKQSNKVIERPENFDQMIKLAQELSEGIPHVRVDFYNIGGKIYTGEFTFFTGGGMKPFIPREWDYKLGEMINFI